MFSRIIPLFILTLLLSLPTPASAARTPVHGAHPAAKPAPDSPDKFYHRVFDAVADNNPQQVEAMIARGPDPILNKVARGYAMALPSNDYTFDQLDSFIADNPGWPGLKGIQMIAEQKMPANIPPAAIITWFTNHPPVTAPGFNAYVDALNISGMANVAMNAIRARWISGDFTGDELNAYYQHYGALLDAGAMWARMDRLLWKNDEVNVKRMMPYISASDQVLAQARLALATQESGAGQWLARVPASQQNDPGLLYQKLRWLAKDNRDDEADEILLSQKTADMGNAEEWWNIRQVMVRRAIEAHNFALAYRLASEHGQTDPRQSTQAEFLAGWLALRFLNKPELARGHFQSLYDNASTPVSRARGAYWLGRADEALGDKNAAEQAYEDAAVFDTSYYGQLATTRLYPSPTLTARADPPLPDAVRKNLMSRDIIRAIIRLNDIGEDEHARSFFHSAVDAAAERAEFVILTEIATRMHRPDLGIQAVKAANQKDMLVENGGFPVLALHVPTPPEAAFTHALIRQESLFNPDASSGVGARGLMQLMPRTAKDTAKRLNMRYSESRLGEPDYNLRLGTEYVEEQIEHFNGSYVLALAGYNAGAGRVHEWLTIYGDPRNPDIDPVDWVELIPIQETRNYVQRIIENLQIYRAKLAGGTAPLLILNDLKR